MVSRPPYQLAAKKGCYWTTKRLREALLFFQKAFLSHVVDNLSGHGKRRRADSVFLFDLYLDTEKWSGILQQEA